MEHAMRCERRCPGAPDDEEERTGDRSEHGGGVFIRPGLLPFFQRLA